MLVTAPKLPQPRRFGEGEIMAETSPILGPVVALVAWTLVMMAWMYALRLPALSKAIDVKSWHGGTGAQIEGMLAPRVQWPAHNYNHLHEQPTLFYAICLTLALLDLGGGLNLWLAWTYVALRVVHSLVQATWNKVVVRFALFALASLCLLALTLHAGAALLHG
jgi:hypothetical protein